MLQPSSVLRDRILNLPMANSVMEGVSNLVNVIGDYMDQVQGGSAGAPGIFKLNRSAMIAQLSSLTPVSDNSWVQKVVAAWEAAVVTSTITPSTVTNAAWVGSGGKDIATLPVGGSTILTVPVAKSILMSALLSARPDDQAPQPVADGVSNGTKAFTFNCIGLGPSPTLTPIPVPTPAQ